MKKKNLNQRLHQLQQAENLLNNAIENLQSAGALHGMSGQKNQQNAQKIYDDHCYDLKEIQKAIRDVLLMIAETS